MLIVANYFSFFIPINIFCLFKLKIKCNIAFFSIRITAKIKDKLLSYLFFSY